MSTKPAMPPVEQLRGRQLGRILIKMGRIRRAEVLEALEIQKEQGGPLGSILVMLGHITEEDLQLALVAQVGMGTVDLARRDVLQEVINMIPAQMANTYKVIPFDYDEDRHCLSVAISTPDIARQRSRCPPSRSMTASMTARIGNGRLRSGFVRSSKISPTLLKSPAQG